MVHERLSGTGSAPADGHRETPTATVSLWGETDTPTGFERPGTAREETRVTSGVPHTSSDPVTTLSPRVSHRARLSCWEVTVRSVQPGGTGPHRRTVLRPRTPGRWGGGAPKSPSGPIMNISSTYEALGPSPQLCLSSPQPS